MSKVKLNILGLSYSQTQSGAYALVLTEENGERRIPIIIGGVEAQAIAIHLEELQPPRPLTHDLFVSFANAFSIRLLEVNIFKLEEGIFYSELLLFDGTNHVKIDSRTSDAVALALRFKCPIYTTEEIISKAGIVISPEKETQKSSSGMRQKTSSSRRKSAFTEQSKDELRKLLEEAINQEDYEKASEIRDEINRREEEK